MGRLELASADHGLSYWPLLPWSRQIVQYSTIPVFLILIQLTCYLKCLFTNICWLCVQLLTPQQSNCDNIQYYEIEYQKRGSNDRLRAMAPQSANAKNLSENVEFDSEYWLVVIAHNNQPLDSSSNTVRIITHLSCESYCYRTVSSTSL